jgi:glucokinase
MIILAADVGGTKSNLGLFGAAGESPAGAGPLRLVADRSYRTHDFESVAAMLLRFLADAGSEPRQVAGACVGIAGPVEDGASVAEWLPWRSVNEREVAAGVGIPHTRLINDMVATAWGVTVLRPEQLVTLNPGEPGPHRNVAVIAAGTGLGESALVFDDGKYHALGCEGGHTDFAPRNEAELGLFRYLLARTRPVNQEAVICGRGLVNVYEYFRSLETGEAPPGLAESGSRAGEVARLAAAGPGSTAGKAMDLFVSAYGARAGCLAMQVTATGGVFVGGGIAPKNVEKFRDGTFLEAFLDKGDLFRPILRKIPVHIVLEQRTALIGAAQYAVEHL